MLPSSNIRRKSWDFARFSGASQYVAGMKRLRNPGPGDPRTPSPGFRKRSIRATSYWNRFCAYSLWLWGKRMEIAMLAHGFELTYEPELVALWKKRKRSFEIRELAACQKDKPAEIPATPQEQEQEQE